jgi:hypothetical protein
MATWHTASEALDVVRDGINTSDMSEKMFAWVDSARALASEVDRQRVALDAAEQRAVAAEAERDKLRRVISEGTTAVSEFLRSYGGESCHMDMERWLIRSREAAEAAKEQP